MRGFQDGGAPGRQRMGGRSTALALPSDTDVALGVSGSSPSVSSPTTAALNPAPPTAPLELSSDTEVASEALGRRLLAGGAPGVQPVDHQPATSSRAELQESTGPSNTRQRAAPGQADRLGQRLAMQADMLPSTTGKSRHPDNDQPRQAVLLPAPRQQQCTVSHGADSQEAGLLAGPLPHDGAAHAWLVMYSQRCGLLNDWHLTGVKHWPMW